MERLILKDRNEIKLELVVSVSFLAHSTAFQWGCSPGGTVRGDPSQHQHSLLNRIALPYYFFISFHYWHEVICVFSCSLSSHKSVIFVGMRTVGFIPYVPSAWNIGGTIKVGCLLNKRMKKFSVLFNHSVLWTKVNWDMNMSFQNYTWPWHTFSS